MLGGKTLFLGQLEVAPEEEIQELYIKNINSQIYGFHPYKKAKFINKNNASKEERVKVNM